MAMYEPITKFSLERAEILAKLIESQLKSESYYSGDGFNMARFAHRCGTPSCIAGWAATLIREPARDATPFDLEQFLGCTWEQANWLAYGRFKPDKLLGEITPAEAATAIREMAAVIARGEDFAGVAKF